MNVRVAIPADIPQMQIVRTAVTENILSNPDLVTTTDYLDFISTSGKGWVCEVDQRVVGFAVVDLVGNNVWALFVHPDYAEQGIGRQLHDVMLNWYFQQTTKTLWLGTDPKTRAEMFYRKSGWREIGIHGQGEIKFEMTYEDWQDA